MTKKEIADATLAILQGQKAQYDNTYAISNGRMKTIIAMAQEKVNSATDDPAGLADFPQQGLPGR